MEFNELKWKKEVDFTEVESMMNQMKRALNLMKSEYQRKYDETIRLKIQQGKDGLGKKKV